MRQLHAATAVPRSCSADPTFPRATLLVVSAAPVARPNLAVAPDAAPHLHLGGCPCSACGAAPANGRLGRLVPSRSLVPPPCPSPKSRPAGWPRAALLAACGVCARRCEAQDRSASPAHPPRNRLALHPCRRCLHPPPAPAARCCMPPPARARHRTSLRRRRSRRVAPSRRRRQGLHRPAALTPSPIGAEDVV